jgi:hypothetical protein
MPPQTLVGRVVKLENEMAALRELPAQVAELASQVLQLRGEMRAEFLAIRGEIRAGDEETRSQLRGETHTGFSAIREEIREGDEETRRQMRVLHEDVIGRIALLQEGLVARRKKR